MGTEDTDGVLDDALRAMAEAGGRTYYEDPPLTRILFNTARFVWLWAIIRVWLGWQWIGAALKTFWERAVAIPQPPARPAIAFEAYRDFLQFLLNTNSYTWFAKLVAYGELLIGIALIVGAFVGIAAFFGGLMNWSFMMAGSASTASSCRSWAHPGNRARRSRRHDTILSRMRKDVLPVVAVTLVTLAAWAGAAAAHARLLRASPSPASALTAAPKEVRAWFSEELEPKGSTLTVWDRRGTQVDVGKGGVDLNDLDRKSMVVKLKPLQPGKYTVRWKALSADDLTATQGAFQFTVRPK